MKKFYQVTAKCGHVGRGHYVAVDFGVQAESGSAAAALARMLPRVKHDHPDAILNVIEITCEEYAALRRRNRQDPYLQCTNVQEQRCIEGLENRLIPEETHIRETARNGAASRRSKRREADEDERLEELLDYRRGRYFAA